jgi:DNA-binding XRE family transcriptional regulator
MEALETVRNLEAQLAETKKEVARELRVTRESLGLSRAKAAYKVGLTQGALLNIEQNKSWKTKTIARIARFYDRQKAA